MSPRRPPLTPGQKREQLEEMARAQGIRPMTLEEYRRIRVFESDEEIDEFLAFVRELRNSDTA